MMLIDDQLQQAATRVRREVGTLAPRPVDHILRRQRIRGAVRAGVGAVALITAVGTVGVLLGGVDEAASPLGDSATTAPTRTTVPPTTLWPTTTMVAGVTPVVPGGVLPLLGFELEGWTHSEVGDFRSETVPGYSLRMFRPTEDELNTALGATLQVRGIPEGSAYESSIPFWESEDYEVTTVRGYEARLYTYQDTTTSYTIAWRESESVVAWVDVLGISRSATRQEALSVANAVVPISQADWDRLLAEQRSAPTGVTTTVPPEEAPDAEARFREVTTTTTILDGS